MSGKAQLAGMRGQGLLVARGMLDGMHPRHQLGAEQGNDEKETQGIHGNSVGLVDLQQQALKVLAFREIQRHRMIGGTGQAADDASATPGIQRRPGGDFLE